MEAHGVKGLAPTPPGPMVPPGGAAGAGKPGVACGACSCSQPAGAPSFPPAALSARSSSSSCCWWCCCCCCCACSGVCRGCCCWSGCSSVSGGISPRCLCCSAIASNCSRTAPTAAQRGRGVRGGEAGGGGMPLGPQRCCSSAHMGARDSTMRTSAPASRSGRRTSCICRGGQRQHSQAARVSRIDGGPQRSCVS